MLTIVGKFIACELPEEVNKNGRMEDLFEDSSFFMPLTVAIRSYLEVSPETRIPLHPSNLIYVRKDFLNDYDKYVATIEGLKIIQVPNYEVMAISSENT